MKSPNNPNKWFEWFGGFADGTLSPEDFEKLQKSLREDPECRRLWNLHCDLELDLPAVLAASETVRTIPFPTPHTVHEVPTRKRTSLRGWSIAAAAAAVLVLGILSITTLYKEPAQTLVQIIENRDATQQSGALNWSTGDQVAISTLDLLSGDLRFSTKPGIDVTATAPVSLEIITPMHIRVLSGKVTAEAIPGFIIETQQARLVDLGTQFGVEVNPSSGTHLVVFDGEVEVRNPSSKSGPPLATITEGRGVNIASEGQLLPISHIITGPMVDAWQINSKPDETSIITEVSDNVPESTDQRFYPVFPNGLEEGVRAFPYQRNTPRWWGTRPGGFPELLQGADFVQTLQRELNNPDLEITLNLSRPCDLFVFHESEAPAPEWLVKEFKLTGTQLILSPEPPPSDLPGDRSIQPLRIYNVWSRRVDAPGLVTLGPVHRESTISPPHYMYGIAAKPVGPDSF
jgi:ferric-dicitrate binding protein FerR (iron transport regulator)